MANKKLSDDAILSQLPAAKARSKVALTNRVRGHAASVDRKKRLLTVALTNGSAFSVPIEKVPGLERASMDDAAAVSLDAVGMGLHWDQLDVDLSVIGLARIALGASNLLTAAGKAGGEMRSTAKTEAARRNGLKGGRPKRARPKIMRDKARS
jgi:hypothetical protein